MKVTKTPIEGLVIIEPQVYGDARGYFKEVWTRRDFEAAVGAVDFVQENQSRSHRGVVRGLHFQRPPYAQAKLVRVVEGTVLDVAVDLRSGSPTYGNWHAVELSADNHRQLFIPRGMAHGFAVLSDTATFIYLCDNYYHPEVEDGLPWNDPAIGIDWHIDTSEVILSPKDMNFTPFAEFVTPF